jgi:5-methyltetrahydropteroyltriglutamate--homocysteine methyltransferase
LEVCRGPIVYERREPLERDLTRFQAVLAEADCTGGFMNAPSPGIIALFQPNEYYPSLHDYLAAIAAMKVEYDAIVDAGLTLQIDAPDLAMGRHIMYRDRSDEDFVAAARRHLEVLNEALRDIPPDRVRLHICWGNYEGPHHLDIDVDKIMDVALAANCSTLVFEASNPRHAHEWTAWASAKIPEEKVLAPGVIDATTNFIEHPNLVAERICRYADIVGPDRVLAATDCGFGTWSGFGAIDPDICWAKLASLAAGASIASDRLF